MNNNHLKFALVTAELSSFSRAAEKCNVTQSTLSNGVSELESILGEKLFLRTTRSVQLSDFGKAMLPFINSILSAEQNLLQQSKNYLNPSKIILKVGLSPLLNGNYTSMLTQSFINLKSEYSFFLIEDNLTQLADKLAKNELDFIFVPIIQSQRSLSHLFLYEEPLVVVTKEMSLLRQEKVTIKDCASYNFVMVPDSCGLSTVTRNLFKKSKVKLHEYDGKALSYSALADWADNGIGSAVLPKSKVPYGMKFTPLLAANGQALMIQYQVIWTGTVSKNQKPFLQYLKNTSERLAKGMI